MGAIIDTLRDPVALMAILVSLAIFATVLSLAMPLLSSDRLPARMRAVADEREKIRQRERARLAEEGRGSLRGKESKAYMRRLVERLSLRKALLDDKGEEKLKQAGFRSEAATTTFLFARFVLPFGFLLVAIFYVFVVLKIDRPLPFKAGICLVIAYAGFYLPVIVVSNALQKRQQSIKRAFPDSLDLLLICVESGMSIELAFRRVSEEIGSQSLPLAEELSLTTAELSFLSDRRQAYENLANRTGLDGVKAVCLALIQSERYGTPLGQTLRVLSQENRDMRMNEAEKKAAALPPKLTVPMILFFLPVLFAVIMAPAIIKITSLH
ncbi:Type II/IV secretion system protein TadC, associated with Flp pilus assembly [uncultured Pleomorphomonas sp.]|uniref:Type II/IV secretion system protein TadC, associated with Flp pilus assembly n=1 Tax=uncultured Pleomorphomonas sp. TaxID=442121 RepID=A0A212LKX4_9HYPH|nr:type II secretion system F family protein [uncultured Pleomorphomonas sp.]SCM78194.1 Type II/IV secretion system protein TadC, associated with Flp pilus assembly [uncultured Pleomorphomonas sp.]